MYMNPNRILQTMVGAAMAIALVAGAQTPTTPAPDPAPAAAPAATPAQADQPAAAPALGFPWKIGPMAVTGFIDGLSLIHI